jgi:GT2 family glycosyltransferase
VKKVIALLPAHNEEVQIGDALDALLAQIRAPDKILVILDNCTDGTEEIVQSYAPAVEYMTTVDNPHKKAGALNQAMAECTDYEYVLDTDADAILDVNFCERAIAEMDADNKIGALSVREGVRDYQDMTWKRRFIYRVVRFQRYQWDTFRMENPQDCMVVVGPGSMIRAEALLDVGGWDNDSLTEDNALSLDLREHGWRTVLGTKCFAWSDTPLHFGELWQQRVRWSRGSEDYAKRSWSKATYKGKLLAKYNLAAAVLDAARNSVRRDPGYARDVAMVVLRAAGGALPGQALETAVLPAIQGTGRDIRVHTVRDSDVYLLAGNFCPRRLPAPVQDRPALARGGITMIIVNPLWLPMFVFGSAVFMVGMFFFARLLLFVRVPFTLRADQAAPDFTISLATVPNETVLVPLDEALR